MVKIATSWKPNDSGTATTPYAGYKVLLETTGRILLETGFFMLLEDTLITTKIPTQWSAN